MRELIRRLVVSLSVPFMILIVFPIIVVIVGYTGGIAWMAKTPWNYITSILGWILVLAGLALLMATIPLFHRQEGGTIMPWEPADLLIVEGMYRYVRNPMHSGVFSVLFGEGLLLRSNTILIFAVLAVLVHLFYIPYSEEPGLERRFGDDYRIYKRNVPRWIPRLTPWEPKEKEQGRNPPGQVQD
jgi:protein-S-isoprenylcysteine O-methyltransferase Ste14